MQNADAVLTRCKALNCVNQGQSISIGLLERHFGGRAEAGIEMKKLVEANLFTEGTKGVYTLTSAGSTEVAAIVETTLGYKSQHFAKRQINKLQ